LRYLFLTQYAAIAKYSLASEPYLHAFHHATKRFGSVIDLLVERTSMNRFALVAMATVFAAGAGVAQASTVGNVTPGWGNGSGTANGQFTIETDSTTGIELGLRAKLRQSPDLIAPVGDVYSVPAGAQIGVPNRAAWNYEFSIYIPATSGLNLNTIHAELTVTDPNSHSATVNPLTQFPDYTGAPGLIVAQNSENPSFTGSTGFPLDTYYNMDTPGNYIFTLAVYGDNAGAKGDLLVSDSMTVAVAPLPSAAWAGLGLMGAVALGGVLRKKFRTA
jgi:hypothetical protein